MSPEYPWQVQSRLSAHRTGEKALDRLERWHRNDVPSPQLDGAVVERCFLDALLEEEPVPGDLHRDPWVNVDFASAMTA